MILSSPAERGGRAPLLLALLLLAALTAVAMLTRPLTPVDETRYVSVAWEMWQRGDFLVPYKNGETYSHKPPFLFWTIHAGWTLFGVNDWWPRLVMPLSAALALLATWRLAQRLWPQQPGLGAQAALVLSGTLLWIVFSTSLMFDTMLALWVLLGMHGVLMAAGGQKRGFALLGLAIGLGVLTKGPVILLNLLPVTALAPWWNPGLKWGRWFGGVLLAVLLGAAIALAWAIPAGLAGGEAYSNAIFWGQTADRMVESFAHRRPFWWYLPLLPLLLFPWFVWPGLWQALGRQRRAGFDRGLRFCIAWMLPVLISFSFISGKQPHYLLPLFPAFALMTARVLAVGGATRVSVPALLALVLAAALLAAASGQIPSLRDEVAALPPFWPGAFLAGIAMVAWWAGRRGVPPVAALAVLGAATLALVQWAARPALAPLYDVRPLAQAIRAVQEEGRPVANLATYHAQYQFAGRLEKPLVELQAGEIGPWLDANPNGYAVVYLKDRRVFDALEARHKQAYRGGWAALVEPPAVAGLPGHGGN